MPFWTKSAKALTRDSYREKILESPGIPITDDEADLDDDAAYDYTEPERGPFDYPHRIRPVQQMIDDDLASPITADAFIAYSQRRARVTEASNEFGLSVWECMPDDDGSSHAFSDEPEPIATVAPCCGVDEEGNEYFCDEDVMPTVAATGKPTLVDRIRWRLRR